MRSWKRVKTQCLHKMVQELTGYRMHIAISLETKDGNILIHKDVVIQVCTEYVKALYANDNRSEAHNQEICDYPTILNAILDDALKHINKK